MRTVRSSTTINEFEEKAHHGFDNTLGAGHVTGVYQWVDKIYESQVYNYGRRLMFDVMVPEPAAFYIYAQRHQKAEGKSLQKPAEFTLRPDQLDETNYLKYALVVDSPIEVVLLSSIAVLRPGDRIMPYYLRYAMQDPRNKGRLANHVSGVAIPRIVVRDFARFAIPVPPLRLQRLWWEVIDPDVKMIHCLRSMNSQLRKARDLLLPKLMSGEIEV